MTTLRIAHAEARPGQRGNIGYLVVLADTVSAGDGGHRVVPVWLGFGLGAVNLLDLLERPADQVITAGVPQEVTARLLGAAGARVTGVDIDVTTGDAGELNPDVAVARIGLAGQAGTRQVTADLGLGLALAAAVGAPVRLADAVLDRLAVPVPDDDLLAPFLGRVPPIAAAPAMPGYGQRWPLVTLRGPRPRYEPRNLDFADGLDRWDLDSWPGPEPDRPEPDRPEPGRPEPGRPEPDYAVAAEGPSGVLSSVVPRPACPAAMVQTIYADDYRGATVTVSGDISADPLTGQTGLRLEILRGWWQGMGTREDHCLTIRGRRRVWTRYELTVRIPVDAELIRFGIGLTGTGRVALRNPGLRRAEPGAEPAAGTP